MATTYSLATFNDPAVVRPQAGVIVRIVSITPASWAVNDVFKFAKLPYGAKLVALGNYIESPDIDTHATPTATVSLLAVDAATATKTIIDGSIAPQAGGTVHDQTATYGQQTGWVGYKVVNKRGAYYALKAAAAAATFAAGAIVVQVTYSTDGEYSD